MSNPLKRKAFHFITCSVGGGGGGDKKKVYLFKVVIKRGEVRP
jgi:hypothetical protein